MRISGTPVARVTREVVLERPDNTSLKFSVSSISIGIRREFDKLYPTPSAPKIVTQTVKEGRKDTPNWDDPAFVEALKEREHLQNIYLVYSVLKYDKNVEFDNKPTDVESLRRLATEFAESGLSEGDMLLLLKEAMKASNISNEDIERAKSSF